MSKESPKILGLFSSLLHPGGVECSGRIAWQGIVDRVGGDRARLCCYEPRNQNRGVEEEADLKGSGHTREVALSKFGALAMALRRRWRADTILVWHLHLLRLVPLFRLPKARVVVFLHGIEAWRRTDWLTRRLCSRVHLFLTNSHYTWAQFVQSHPRLQSIAHRIVHLGLDTPLPAQPVSPSQPPAVLMLGRLAQGEDYKGHREVITAWPVVCERIPNAELWIAGNGGLQTELQALVGERDLSRRIRFYGRVSEEEKQRLLVQCRCLALPSRAEGFGLVYLEAMRLGRPCLVSTLDAGREVVNPPEAGLSVDPRDPRALADAVCRLLTPGQAWEDWSVRARQRYEQNFTAVHFQQRLLEALACS
jgi:phosphatidyl-myo-inositol dimannoside synthase